MKIVDKTGEWLEYRPGVEVQPVVGATDGSPVGVSRVRVVAGAWLTPEDGERHPEVETLFVHRGTLRVERAGSWEDAVAPAIVHVAANEWHKVRAGDGGAELVVVASPDWEATNRCTELGDDGLAEGRGTR